MAYRFLMRTRRRDAGADGMPFFQIGLLEREAEPFCRIALVLEWVEHHQIELINASQFQEQDFPDRLAIDAEVIIEILP